MAPVGGQTVTGARLAKKLLANSGDVTKLIGPSGDAGGKILKQVPDNWLMKPAKKCNWTRFVDPSNPHKSVRTMEGNTSSRFPNSRQPYTKQIKDGSHIDINGNRVPHNSPDAHIPTSLFIFRR